LAILCLPFFFWKDIAERDRPEKKKRKKAKKYELKNKEKLLNFMNIYIQFIEKARQRALIFLQEDPSTYVEKHHILPRFASGLDEEKNLVQLTYRDHITAHYIRWRVYKDPRDLTAYKIMSGQVSDIRREIASLGGKIGGQIAQQQNKEHQRGRFNSETQRIRGQKGAAANKAQGTGAWDSANLEKANKVQAKNPELYREQKLKNLETGRITQKQKGINIGNSTSQRRKSLQYRGIVLNGKYYSLDTEQRTYVSDTTLDYYLLYAPKKSPK
jgi:hypothetical protein